MSEAYDRIMHNLEEDERMALIITVGGELIPSHPQDPKMGYNNVELSKIVGGWLEVVRLADTEEGMIALIVDEEGQLKNKPPNRLASLFYSIMRGGDQAIVGTAIMVEIKHPGKDEEWIG